MHAGEYEAMARAEERHWWYRGLRDALRVTLSRPDLRLPAGARVLDAGCGTGANLRLLEREYAPGYLGGFDLSPEALALAAERGVEADLYRSDICDPELRADELDLIVSMDVVYIPGVERALGGLERLVDALKPGGLLALNLPAYDWLYSEHDAAIHTSERYTTARVGRLLERLGLTPRILSYRVAVLFPLVVATRLPGMWKARRRPQAARSDLHRLPGELTNRICLGTLRWENRRIAAGLRLPWGSSVFAIARKEGR